VTIEEDLANAMKFAGFAQFGGKFNMGGLTKIALLNMRLNMLKTIRSNIGIQIAQLEGILRDANASTGPRADSTYRDDMNPFVILNVDPDASRDEIDKAYKKKARECHPDKGGTDMDMVKVNAAYESIKMMRGW
jgi:hypothetical protein